MKRVIVIGGGFGGLSFIKKMTSSSFKVTLIDKKNYHLFQPLLYQVATATVSPAEIAMSFRSLLSNQENLEIVKDEVVNIDKTNKRVITKNNEYEFDYLVLACGSTYTYFNNPSWERFAPTLKTIPQATEIRRKIFDAFEKAEIEKDIEKRKSLLTFVIVGGGPTGVELAGSIGEITRFNLSGEFKHINPSLTRVILLEAGPRILPTMTENLSFAATKQLNELGVQIWPNSRVNEVVEQGIRIGNDFLNSDTIIWAAGVGPNPINKMLEVPLDRQGRVIVQEDLSIENFPDIFVIGDQAHYKWGAKGEPLPGLAPVAIQQGRFLSRFIQRKEKKKNLPKFEFFDKGQMATIGRSRAVAMYKGMEIKGTLAWFAWLLVHIYYLIGFKNRLAVLFNWAWTYVTFRRGARLIIDKE